VSGEKCPTCGKQGLPRDALRDCLGIDTDAACAHLIAKDGGRHLRGMATHHPAALVRALAKALLACQETPSQSRE
jgi:hypothetical protein